MGFLSNIFGAKSRKKALKLDRDRARAAMLQTDRDRAQYEENSASEEQQLESSLASRGLGNSSIGTGNREAFARGRTRALANFSDQQNLAGQTYKLARRTYKQNKLLAPLSFLDDVLGAAGTVAGVSNLFGGGGGAESAADRGSPQYSYR